MQDSSAMPQVQVSPQSSIPSNVPVSAPVSQPMPQAPTIQTSYPTQQPVYQQPVAPAAPDPWQAAYENLSARLSGTPQYRSQAPSWPATPSVPDYQAPFPSAAPSYQPVFGSATPTSYPQAMPAYSPSYQNAWPAVAPSVMSAASAPAAEPVDAYLNGVSSESLEVLQHFGAEAPALLNRYACTVEDALLAQAQQSTDAILQLQQLHGNLQQLEAALNATLEDNQAYNLLTTNPDLLADYVNEFFGPNGPVPVETERDRLQADVAAASPGYQRPQMQMPAPGYQPSANNEFWGAFQQVASSQPDQLWKLLAQAPADALRGKLLIADT